MILADQPPTTTPAGDIGDHLAPQLLVALASVFGFFAIATRLFARYKIGKLGIPDVFLVIAAVFYVGLLYNGYQAAIYPGFGVHQWQYNPELASKSHFSFKLGTLSFGIGIAFIKIAILLDWKQIFVPTGTHNILFWVLHLLILSNALFYFIGTFIDAFQCPIEAGIGRCGDRVQNYIFGSGIVNVVSDLAILIVPHLVVWKLNMSKAQKKGVSILFIIGFFATASAVIRLAYVNIAEHTQDVLYYYIIVNLWAIAEQTFGFLVLGVPAIPKAFQGFKWAKRFNSIATSRSDQPVNPSDYCERRATLPISSPRRRRDPWDTDTRALVLGEGESYISLPDQVHLRDEREGQHISTAGVGAATV
ncbi:hypothetical protein GGR58DRAFT_516623 [Xylaria digitata]|nr:hypothetical protein GGR58DRAFT_516623 [Xylaria digitata]